MIRSISTYVFLQQRLHAGHLDALLAGGAQSIELFAARHHFDYADRAEVKEIAKWFRSNNCRATLHQPIWEGRASGRSDWSRYVQPTLNLIDPEKTRRIDAMDEVKRSLEAAEEIAIDSISLHLGAPGDAWSERTLDLSMTAVEHIKAFAHPLGVTTLVETLPNEVSTPEHLLDMLRIAHLNTVGICLDVGHMNLPGMPGVAKAFEVLGPRVKQVHLHDNRGERDEHCWPGEGTVDWGAVRSSMAAVAESCVGTLEIHYQPELSSRSVSERAAKAFALCENTA